MGLLLDSGLRTEGTRVFRASSASLADAQLVAGPGQKVQGQNAWLQLIPAANPVDGSRPNLGTQSLTLLTARDIYPVCTSNSGWTAFCFPLWWGASGACLIRSKTQKS